MAPVLSRSSRPTTSTCLPAAALDSIRGTPMSRRTCPLPAMSHAGPVAPAERRALVMAASRSSCMARMPGTMLSGSWPQWLARSSSSMVFRCTLSSG